MVKKKERKISAVRLIKDWEILEIQLDNYILLEENMSNKDEIAS